LRLHLILEKYGYNIARTVHCAVLALCFKLTSGDDVMNYEINTPHGLFEVIQSLSYGDMIIAGVLVVIAVIVGFKTLYDIADREGFI